MKNKYLIKINKIILYFILIIFSIGFIFPFIWMIRSSFMSITQIFIMPPQWIPDPFTLEGYNQAITQNNFIRYGANTLFILVLGTFGSLLTASMAAYSFSRINWTGRNLVFSLVLATMMLPSFVTLIPQFIMWNSMGFYNTYVPLIAPAYLGGGAFNIFLLRQFFMSIPKELDEAAFIDGATHFDIYTKIMLPLCKSALIVVGIFLFMFYWNDFFNPLIYLSSSDKFTLSIGLQQMMGQYTSKWNVLMAASTLVIIPCLVIFSIGQKYLLEGIAMSGLKG